MLTQLLLFTAVACTVQPGTMPNTPSTRDALFESTQSDSLREAYVSGATWDEFYSSVRARRSLWQENWSTSAIPDSVISRARRTGPWRILIIAQDNCSDSVNTVPFIARLVAGMPGSEIRIIGQEAGMPLMERFPTRDGRPATPTVLLLDPDFNLRGCWIEQPKKLQEFWLPVLASGTSRENIQKKMDWYKADEGRETVGEIVEIMEAAAAGDRICGKS